MNITHFSVLSCFKRPKKHVHTLKSTDDLKYLNCFYLQTALDGLKKMHGVGALAAVFKYFGLAYKKEETVEQRDHYGSKVQKFVNRGVLDCNDTSSFPMLYSVDKKDVADVEAIAIMMCKFFIFAIL